MIVNCGPQVRGCRSPSVEETEGNDHITWPIRGQVSADAAKQKRAGSDVDSGIALQQANVLQCRSMPKSLPEHGENNGRAGNKTTKHCSYPESYSFLPREPTPTRHHVVAHEGQGFRRRQRALASSTRTCSLQWPPPGGAAASVRQCGSRAPRRAGLNRALMLPRSEWSRNESRQRKYESERRSKECAMPFIVNCTSHEKLANISNRMLGNITMPTEQSRTLSATSAGIGLSIVCQ